jgi:hypothetical protein
MPVVDSAALAYDETTSAPSVVQKGVSPTLPPTSTTTTTVAANVLLPLLLPMPP